MRGTRTCILFIFTTLFVVNVRCHVCVAAREDGRQQAGFARSGGIYAGGSPSGVFGKLNTFRAHPDTDINERLRTGRDEDLINVVQLNYDHRWGGDRADAIKKLDGWLNRTDLSLVDAVHLSEEQAYNADKWLDPLFDCIKAYDPSLPVYVWPTFPLGPMGKADGYVYDAYGEGYMASRRNVMRFLRTGKPLIMCVDASGYSDYRAAREQLMVCHEFDIPVFYFVADHGAGSYNNWYGQSTMALSACRNFMFSAMEFQRRCRGPEALSAGDLIWGEQIELAPNREGEVHYNWAEFGQATVYGFTRLKPEAQGVRVTGSATVAMDYQFWSLLPVENARLALKVSRDAMQDGIQVAYSRCGKSDDWRPVEVIAENAATDELSYDLGNPGQEFRVRVTLATGAVLHGGRLSGRCTSPSDHAIRLDTHFDGWRNRILFRQHLASGLWRAMATVDKPKLLNDNQPQLALQGKIGHAISVNVVEKFRSDYPLEHIVVRLSGMSHSALGGSYALAISMDGKTIKKRGASDSEPRADGYYQGTHSLDLSGDPDFQGIQEFYVHMIQKNSSGLKTNTSSRLDLLEIDATRVK